MCAGGRGWTSSSWRDPRAERPHSPDRSCGVFTELIESGSIQTAVLWQNSQTVAQRKRGLLLASVLLLLVGATALVVSSASAGVTSSHRALVDADGDGVDDSIDNCVGSYNPDQRDTDTNGVGNRCDATPFASSFSEVMFYPRNTNGVFGAIPDPGWCFHYVWSDNVTVDPHSGDACARNWVLLHLHRVLGRADPRPDLHDHNHANVAPSELHGWARRPLHVHLRAGEIHADRPVLHVHAAAPSATATATAPSASAAPATGLSGPPRADP